MIRVFTGHRVKKGEDVLPLLLQLRSSEMTFPGLISSENLLSDEGSDTVVTVSTWERKSDFKAWETSKIRQTLLAQLEGFLVDVPKVTVYRIMPTVGWQLR
jgi:antibiotic biosynthesis monooxygenase (ABM) superfamily enzyme